eukprot:4956027-Alexandrium_andersonii.AAC.1
MEAGRAAASWRATSRPTASRISRASDRATPLTTAVMSPRSCAPCCWQARSRCRRTRSQISTSP